MSDLEDIDRGAKDLYNSFSFNVKKYVPGKIMTIDMMISIRNILKEFEIINSSVSSIGELLEKFEDDFIKRENPEARSGCIYEDDYLGIPKEFICMVGESKNSIYIKCQSTIEGLRGVLFKIMEDIAMGGMS